MAALVGIGIILGAGIYVLVGEKVKETIPRWDLGPELPNYIPTSSVVVRDRE